MKRLISIVMAAVMVALMVPAAVFAASKVVIPPNGKPDFTIGKAPLDDTVEFNVSFEVGNNLPNEVSGMPENISIKLSFKEAKNVIKNGLIVAVPQQAPSSPYCRFVGWTTTKSSSGVIYRPGDEIKLSHKNRSITLYGVWEQKVLPTASVVLMPTD